MRHSTLLLVSSLALHVPVTHIAEATAPAAETVHDFKQAHTFLEIKNDTRPLSLLTRYGGTPEDDERMFRVKPPMKIVGPVIKEEMDKIGPVLVGKTPFFKKYIKGHSYTNTDLVSHVLETMETEKMTEEVNTFRRKDKFLADEFIDDYGIGAVATALVNAKHSANEKTKTNGQTLLDDLLTSLDKTTKGDYQKVFIDRLKLNENQIWGFVDGRVELLDDLIKSHHGGQPNDQVLFETLEKSHESNMVLAHNIGLVAKDSEAAQRLETRYIKYWIDVLKVDTLDIIRWLGLSRFGYQLFQQREFEMVKKFLLLKGVSESELPQTMLKALLEGHLNSEKWLARTLAEGVISGDTESGNYEWMLFEILKDKNYNSKSIEKFFDPWSLKTYPSANEFVKQYKTWYKVFEIYGKPTVKDNK